MYSLPLNHLVPCGRGVVLTSWRRTPHVRRAQVPLSVQAISWVIDESKHKLGNLVVLLMIANHAKSDGSGAWPSVPTLARESRMSERQVQRCIRLLEKSGELQVSNGTGPHGCNVYAISTGVTNCHQGGRQIGHRGVTFTTERGDIAVSPEPSLTVLKGNRHKPRANTSRATDHRRNIEARDERRRREREVEIELNVGRFQG